MSPTKIMHKINPITQSLLLALAITLFPLQLAAAEIDLGRAQLNQSAEVSAVLNVMASEPTAGTTTTIEASGMWNTGCVPEFSSVELTSDPMTVGDVDIMAISDPAGVPCGQSETEWRFPVDVQFEQAGEYMIRLFITNEQLGTTEVHASEYLWVEGNLVFNPQAPAPNEPVTVTVTGVNGDACVPEYASHEVIDGKIVIDVMSLDSICGQVLTSWSVDVTTPALESGDYIVEVYHSEQYEGEPTNRALYKTETLSVGVSAANVTDYFIYLPGIVLD